MTPYRDKHRFASALNGTRNYATPDFVFYIRFDIRCRSRSIIEPIQPAPSARKTKVVHIRHETTSPDTRAPRSPIRQSSALHYILRTATVVCEALCSPFAVGNGVRPAARRRRSPPGRRLPIRVLVSLRPVVTTRIRRVRPPPQPVPKGLMARLPGVGKPPPSARSAFARAVLGRPISTHRRSGQYPIRPPPRPDAAHVAPPDHRLVTDPRRPAQGSPARPRPRRHFPPPARLRVRAR